MKLSKPVVMKKYVRGYLPEDIIAERKEWKKALEKEKKRADRAEARCTQLKRVIVALRTENKCLEKRLRGVE